MRHRLMTSLVIAGLMLLAPFQVVAAPVVVELFQSQGCSDCPPAIANVNAIADRPDILALNFSVTYWDRLGWKDTFAKPEFTARQWDYAHGLHNANVYTPQIVVNGKRDLVGANRADLDQAISQAAPLPAVPALAYSGNRISVGAASTAAGARAVKADIWLVRFDPRVLNVAIGAGENSGLTLPHKNIVRELSRLGTWSGKAEQFTLPSPAESALQSAILVQAEKGGPILSALKF